MNIAKAVVQALGAVLVAILPFLFVGPLKFSEIINIIVVAIGALLVWNAKNYPNWKYGKFVASLAATITTFLVAIASYNEFGDVSAQQWWQLVIAVLTSIGVYLVPNAGYIYRETYAQEVPPRVV